MSVDGEVGLMALNISGNTYNYMQNFFQGLNSQAGSGKSASAGGGLSSLVGDFSAVKNGSYAKLAQKYYKNNAKAAQSKSQSADAIKQDANSAVAGASRLLNQKLYEAKKIKAEDGTETEGYDRETILSNLKDFISGYNSTVKAAGESTNNSVLKSASRMVTQTRVYAGALNRAGITLKSDNTLELDETRFRDAHMSDIKSLFSGSVSFGKHAQERLYQIYSAADTNQTQAAVYNANAQYNISTGNMFDSLF